MYLFILLGYQNLFFLFMAIMIGPILRGGHQAGPLLNFLFVPHLRDRLRTDLHLQLYTLVILVGSTALGAIGFALNWEQILGPIGLHINPIVLLAYVFFVWSLWHLAAQNYGVLALYALKAGQKLTHADRQADRLYNFMITVVLLVLTMFTSKAYLGILLKYFPNHSYDRYADLFVIAVSIIAMTVMLTREYLRPNPSWPKSLFYVGIALQTLVCVDSFLYFYTGVIAINHAIVDTGLSGKIFVNSKVISKGRSTKINGRLLYWAFVVVMLAVGATIFRFQFDNPVSKSLFELDIFDLRGGSDFWSTILIGAAGGLFAGIQLCHYFHSKKLYQFSNGESGGEVIRSLVKPMPWANR